MVFIFHVNLKENDVHHVLKQILSVYLKEDPERIKFAKNPNGKWMHPHIFFNLTHTQNIALIAVSQEDAIGIDLEQIREIKRADLIVQRFFSQEEKRYLKKMTFLELWTAKEAWIKAHGGRLLGFKNTPIDWDLMIPIHNLEGYVGYLAFQKKPSNFRIKFMSDREELKALIQAIRLEGQSDSVTVVQAVGRFLKRKRRQDANSRLMKQHIGTLMSKGSLGNLLEQTRCFTPEVMQPILGKELYQHAKPVGFSDKTKKTILIEVKSSSIAHELMFRKAEILSRLKQLKEFKLLNDVRFLVN